MGCGLVNYSRITLLDDLIYTVVVLLTAILIYAVAVYVVSNVWKYSYVLCKLLVETARTENMCCPIGDSYVVPLIYICLGLMNYLSMPMNR